MRLIHQEGYSLTVLWEEVPLLVYNYSQEFAKPFIHPLYAPGGLVLTQNSPSDHPHHRGVFVAWADVSGYDFWSEEKQPDPKKRGRILHQGFQSLRAKRDIALFEPIHRWLTPEGEEVLIEHPKWTVYAPEDPDWYLIDVELVYTSEKEVCFNTPPSYGGLALQLSSEIRGGLILNARDRVGVAGTYGCRAEWCGYAGQTREGRWVGLVVFDHKGNPRHPTFWFVKDEPSGFLSPAFTYAQAYLLQPNQPLRLRYRIAIHSSEPDFIEIQQQYTSYIWST